jgi:16S rRNA (adenine1518-N6/adenine1519-N6)-dimethyltransferase
MSEPEFEDPRKVLARHGLRPKRRFSQSFLTAKNVVEAIGVAVGASPGVTVVELGPGLGTLTGELLRRGARVIGIERDRQMLGVLAAELGAFDRFEAREGDAATVELDAIAREVSGPIRVAGNLPYSITGTILRNLVAQASAFERAVVMVQKEVRDRLLAEPATRAYGALTVFVTARLDVTPVCRVPAGAFHPRPKVESAVVTLTPRPRPRAEETDAFRSVVRAAFDARRKTLKNALARIASPAEVAHALEHTGIDPRRRGETLSVEELADVARALEL